MAYKDLLKNSIFFILLISFLLSKNANAIDDYADNFTNKYQGLFSYRLMMVKQGKDTIMAPYWDFIYKGQQLAVSGRYEESVNWFWCAITYLQLYNDRGLVSSVYVQIGQIYTRMGKHAKAISAYNLALENIYCNHNNIHLKTSRYSIFLSISNVYQTIKDYNKAMFYCDSAIHYFRHNKSNYLLAASLAVKATVYSDMDSSEQSVRHNLSALSTLSKWKVNYTYPKVDTMAVLYLKNIILNNLTNSYLDQHQSDSAGFYLQKIRFFNSDDAQYTKTCFLVTHGRLSLQLSQLKKALHYYQKSLGISQKFRFKDMEISAHKGMAETYHRMGIYKKALLHERRYNTLIDSSNNAKAIHQINQLELENLTERKDRELAQKQLLLARQNNKIKNKNLWITISSISFLFSLGCSALIYRNNKNKQLLHNAYLNNLKHQQEIYALQGKLEGEEEERGRIAVELHDGILSQLMALQLYINILKSKNEQSFSATELNEISEQVELATDELRRTSHNLMPDLLLHQGWEDAVGALCEKTQRYACITTAFQVIGNINVLAQQHALTLYRIVQELIQNVLKHASATELTVQISQRENSLSITVEDNGRGFFTNKIQPATSSNMGLLNIRRRLQLMNGEMDIRSFPGKGTTIYIEVDTNELQDIDKQNTDSE